MDEAWSRFEVSGKITDYLKCKNVESEITQRSMTGSNMEITGGMAAMDSDNRLQKAGPDGTEYRSDRNGLKCNADWRI